MPYYGQINYPQQLGTGNQTIANAGCFLDSFVNLLNRWGEDVNPLTLNQFFIDHNTFIYDADDKGADDLSWSSISQYDPNIVVQNVGGATVPTSNDAIVEFHYNSVHSGLLINHFCLVDHIEGDQLFIVDSYDGIVKGPGAYESVYHKPVAWASYVKNTPVPATPFTITDTYPTGRNLKMNADHPRYQIDQNPVTPMGVQHKDDPIVAIKLASHVNGQQYFMAADSDTTGWDTQDVYDYDPTPVPYVPPAGGLKAPKPTMVTLLANVPTYSSPLDADNRNVDKSVGTYLASPPDYYQFAVEGTGLLNIGKTNQSIDTVWINTKDNLAPPPTPVTPEVVAEQVVAVSEPAPVAPDAWKATFQLFYPTPKLSLSSRGLHYTVNQSGTVADSTHSAHFVISLVVGQDVISYGTVINNGVKYNRIGDPRDPDFRYWFMVPISYQGQAILIVPTNRWINWLVHKEIQLKSIFTEGEPQYIDSILLKPFRKGKK